MGALWDSILDALGQALAFFFDLIPSYGITIILFTLVVRVLLLPLGIKQMRSMQAMQALQPKVRELQRKYKGNRQKLNEEMMALYREHGANPLGGCLPLVAQLPVLFALFAVLRFPGGEVHIPAESELRRAIQTQQTQFLGANLLCSATEAGNIVPVQQAGEETIRKDCGTGIPVRIPYYAFALAMMGTTYYSTRQMQRASPAGQQQQQQAMMRFMPVIFGVWGFFFPAGLVVYWTTTNLAQIAQQHFLLPKAQVDETKAEGDGQRKGARGAKAVEARKKNQVATKKDDVAGTKKDRVGGSAKSRGTATGPAQGRIEGRDATAGAGKPKSGSNGGAETGNGRRPADRKKRRKR